jgi:hypothetical protein
MEVGRGRALVSGSWRIFSACGTDDHVVSHSGAWVSWCSLISVERFERAR